MGDINKRSRLKKASDANKDPADVSGSAVTIDPASASRTPEPPSPIASTPPPSTAGPIVLEAPLDDVIANPHNPREPGDVSDLESIKDGQNQAASAITVAAYLRLWPEDAAVVAGRRWVVHRGRRRDKAARQYGCSTLLIVVDDREATSRENLLGNAILENIDRKDFDPLEEALAVVRMIEECGGRQDLVAQKLSKTPPWVTYRKQLAGISEDLHEAVKSRRLTGETLRQVVRAPAEKQYAVWMQLVDMQEQKAAERQAVKQAAKQTLPDSERPGLTAVNPGAETKPERRAPSTTDLVKVLRRSQKEGVATDMWAEAFAEAGGIDLVHQMQHDLAKLAAKLEERAS